MDEKKVIPEAFANRQLISHGFEEITLDLSPTIKRICKIYFPNAELVSDRFHVQRLMNEAISDMRIDCRWETIELENKEIAFAKELGKKNNPLTFNNGDTRRQLLARSRHIIMKHFSKWTDSQRIRAEILFREYPALEGAYQVSMELTQIYNTTTSKGVGLTRLAHWYNKVERLNIKFFKSVIVSMQNIYDTVANYFIRGATKASAESFNAKIKAFRSQFRGVQDIPFYIFRIEKFFA